MELGNLNVNGGVLDLITAAEYQGIDIEAGPGVDVVADGAEYLPDCAPDLVLCLEVLEHAPDPRAIVANALRMLAPGGALVLTCASTTREPHGCKGGAVGGEHYQGIEVCDLHAWLGGFAHVDVRAYPLRGDLYALAIKGERE